MTIDEAKNLKDPSKLPWDYPCMNILPGRYYLATFSMSVPVAAGKGFPLGGDITGLFWRYDETPEDWVMTWRVRYYVASRTDAWDGKDRKSWYAAKWKGSEESAEKALAHFGDMLSGSCGLFFVNSPPEVDVLMLKGGCEKAINTIIAAKKPWMHMKLASELPK